jgi:hypothetical protein
MSNRPSVVPNKEQKEAADERSKKAAFEAEKAKATNEIYTNSVIPKDTPIGHVDAVELMRSRTEEQIRLKKEVGIVQEPALSETPPSRPLTRNEQEVNDIMKKAEEQIKLRDELLARNSEQIDRYQKYQQESEQNKTKKEIPKYMQNTPVQQPKQVVESYGQTPSTVNPYIVELSQPNFNSPFDVIPLPSEGKLYKNKKPNVRVSFMTTADENILTSPNLLKSGEFLSILINRKLLEPELRYKDLHVGDRNALMIWLRATGYGEMYPVTILDENGEPFETELNLNDLKYKKLGAEPDEEGLFDYKFPLSKAVIKFKLLTCGDLDELEALVETEKENGFLVNNTSTYMIEKTIVEINGNRDKNIIHDFASNLRIRDAKDFRAYLESIESGIDLNINVRTPGGGSVTTFLPLNVNFFWPDFGL